MRMKKLLIVICFAVAFSVNVAGRNFTLRVTAQDIDQKLPGDDLIILRIWRCRQQQPTVDQKLPGDDVIIPSPNDPKWGKVRFTHKQHLEFSSCVYCHHTNEGMTLESFQAGKAGKVPLCVECHTRTEGDEKNPKGSDGTELWSKEAYHINCIDCHKGEITKKPKGITGADIKKQGAGPSKCAECHERRE
jgi:hypothetical protein